VQSRIERLERQGVIAGYTVRVDDEAERHSIRAHIMITVLPRQMAGVVRALHAMPEVRALHSVSGAFDLVALAVVPTPPAMDELTDRIGAIDGVERTTSSIVLSAKFER
jgi:DNA-binding Lrp family transcriptional regulator